MASLFRIQIAPALQSLYHLPFPVTPCITSEPHWASAVKQCMAPSTGDCLLMDDDIILSPDTFKDFEDYYPHADIFGFRLVYPDGKTQHAGGVYQDGVVRHIGEGAITGFPYYVCHCTMSLLYVKRRVIDKIGGVANDFPGDYFEGVDYSFRALKAGYHILYTPGTAINGHGQTRSQVLNREYRARRNWAEIEKRHLQDARFIAQIKGYPVSYTGKQMI